MKRTVSQFLAGVTLVAATASAASAQSNPACGSVVGNLVQNCSFETPTLPPGAAYPSAPVDSWTSSNGTFERWTSGFNGFAARDGISHVELNVNVPTTLSQYLATSIGQRYDLFFSAAHRSGGPATYSKIDVYVDNEFVTSTGELTANFQWVDVSASFVASSENALIEFRGQGTGSFGNHLDNVSVAAVPEPSMAALLLIGGALAAGARRRTRTR
jgi:hypothetical protein